MLDSIFSLECVYCGDQASQRDHVVPHSVTNSREDKYDFDHTKVVPACKECNAALYNRPLFTVAERAQWLLVRLKKKLNQTPTWDKTELNELGKTLRSFVVSQQIKRENLEKRISHLEQVSKLYGFSPENYWDKVWGKQ